MFSTKNYTYHLSTFTLLLWLENYKYYLMCQLVAHFIIAIKSYYTVNVTFFNKSLSHKH